jgi:hypothetical protein
MYIGTVSYWTSHGPACLTRRTHRSIVDVCCYADVPSGRIRASTCIGTVLSCVLCADLHEAESDDLDPVNNSSSSRPLRACGAPDLFSTDVQL